MCATLRDDATAMDCRVMGIVNVTPDSFSDGGRYFTTDEAVRRAKNMMDEGADIVDIGGESTRPGATPISWTEEWSRIGPVLQALGSGNATAALLSVDTYHPETAERALALGAHMINCVYAHAVPEMLALLRKYAHAELVIPATFDLDLPSSASAHDLLPRLYLDPMIGFGTTREEDLALLRSVPALARRGRILVGASRKRIVKKLTGEKVSGKDLGGNLAIAAWCALSGASVVRVHDVRETVQLLKTLSIINDRTVDPRDSRTGDGCNRTTT